MQAKQTPMDVVVVGGSMAGLFHALVLQRLGHRVLILEKSPLAILQSEAAGLSAGPDVQKLIAEYVRPTKPYATTSSVVQLVNGQGEVINVIPSNETLYLTTWSLLHGMLKAAFLAEGGGARFEMQAVVRGVREEGERVVVAYVQGGEERCLEADLVIAADGAHSKIRAALLPGLAPRYVGYVTWRGAVRESAVSDASRRALEGKLLMFRTEGGYTVSYHVPSETGSLSPGERQFIWVWHQHVSSDSSTFRAIFTDVAGTTHQTTIPRGKIQPRIWAGVQARGASLSAPFAELLAATTDPFVSAIREGAAPRAVFLGGRVLLVGDAFAQLRPHVGASTNQAARQALGLGEVFGRGAGAEGLGEWERESVGDARRTGALSVAFGEYCFTGKVPGSLSGVIKAEGGLEG